jgi:hypothetical protein
MDSTFATMGRSVLGSGSGAGARKASSAGEARVIDVQNVAKITPADYPDLLAMVDAGMAQRLIARR